MLELLSRLIEKNTKYLSSRLFYEKDEDNNLKIRLSIRDFREDINTNFDDLRIKMLKETHIIDKNDLKALVREVKDEVS